MAAWGRVGVGHHRTTRRSWGCGAGVLSPTCQTPREGPTVPLRNEGVAHKSHCGNEELLGKDLTLALRKPWEDNSLEAEQASPLTPLAAWNLPGKRLAPG